MADGQTEEVDFDSAFAALMSDDGEAPKDADADDTPPGETDVSADDEGAADEDAANDETPPADDDEAGKQEEPPADDTGEADATGEADEPPAKPAKAAADETPADEQELLARLASLVKDAPEKKDAPAKTSEKAAEPEPELYSEEEKQLISRYQEDWPDVAKAEALMRRGEYRDIVTYVFEQVASQLNPLADAVRTLSERTHLSDLHTAVEDYDDVRDAVVAWVDEQPAYLQAAYKHVITNGTADEVADLVSRYKTEKGIGAPPAPEPAKEPELPAEAKKAADSLAPVGTKRSQVPRKSGIQMDDFPGSFDHFASKLET